mmetsp:Transcript_38024/g.90923  ORF Transcript_38024/g.90923 Transcript_38024/m.90923 type:complete len:289 (+) Transcript_38024:1198-2064(+)
MMTLSSRTLKWRARAATTTSKDLRAANVMRRWATWMRRSQAFRKRRCQRSNRKRPRVFSHVCRERRPRAKTGARTQQKLSLTWTPPRRSPWRTSRSSPSKATLAPMPLARTPQPRSGSSRTTKSLAAARGRRQTLSLKPNKMLMLQPGTSAEAPPPQPRSPAAAPRRCLRQSLKSPRRTRSSRPSLALQKLRAARSDICKSWTSCEKLIKVTAPWANNKTPPLSRDFTWPTPKAAWKRWGNVKIARVLTKRLWASPRMARRKRMKPAPWTKSSKQERGSKLCRGTCRS